MTGKRQKALKLIEKEYNVKIKFVKKIIIDHNETEWMGTCFPEEKLILLCKYTLASSYSFTSFIGAIFHEIGHIYCWENNIYPYYHQKYSLKYFKRHYRKVYRNIRLTGFKAEKYVDNWAAQQMKKHYPRCKYPYAYRTEEDRKWLWENYLCWF